MGGRGVTSTTGSCPPVPATPRTQPALGADKPGCVGSAAPSGGCQETHSHGGAGLTGDAYQQAAGPTGTSPGETPVGASETPPPAVEDPTPEEKAAARSLATMTPGSEAFQALVDQVPPTTEDEVKALGTEFMTSLSDGASPEEKAALQDAVTVMIGRAKATDPPLAPETMAMLEAMAGAIAVYDRPPYQPAASLDPAVRDAATKLAKLPPGDPAREALLAQVPPTSDAEVDEATARIYLGLGDGAGSQELADAAVELEVLIGRAQASSPPISEAQLGHLAALRENINQRIAAGDGAPGPLPATEPGTTTPSSDAPAALTPADVEAFIAGVQAGLADGAGSGELAQAALDISEMIGRAASATPPLPAALMSSLDGLQADVRQRIAVADGAPTPLPAPAPAPAEPRPVASGGGGRVLVQ